MSFNYFTGFLTGYSSIVVIPPRFSSRSVIPNNIPSPLLKKYSPSFDFTMINRFIKAVNDELFANDVFWLNCNEKKAKSELMKLWSLFRSSAINYVLTVPLTWGYYDFPQFILQKNSSNPRQLDFVLSSDTNDDIKNMRLVFVDVFQDFKSKTITATVTVHETFPCPFCLLDDNGVAHFTHNFAYFISRDKTTYNAPYKTKYGAFLCTQSVWFGRYFGNKNYTLIKAMRPFSNSVVASGAIDNVTGFDSPTEVKPIINKSMIEYIRSEFSKRSTLFFRGMSSSDFITYFNNVNSTLLNSQSKDVLLKYVAICDGSDTDATFYLGSVNSRYITLSYPNSQDNLSFHFWNVSSIKFVKFAYKGSYFHDSAIGQDFNTLNELKYISYNSIVNEVTQFVTIDIADIRTGGLLFIWDDGITTGATPRHALVVEFGLDGAVFAVIPNGTTFPYHLYNLQYKSDISYKYDFFVAFMSAIFNSVMPFYRISNDFSQFLSYYLAKNELWLSSTLDTVKMPCLCSNNVLFGMHFYVQISGSLDSVYFLWNSYSYEHNNGGVTFYIFASQGLNNFSASSGVRFIFTSTIDFTSYSTLNYSQEVGEVKIFSNIKTDVPYLVTVFVYLNQKYNSKYGQSLIAQYSCEFTIKNKVLCSSSCNCVTGYIEKSRIGFDFDSKYRFTVHFFKL